MKSSIYKALVVCAVSVSASVYAAEEPARIQVSQIAPKKQCVICSAAQQFGPRVLQLGSKFIAGVAGTGAAKAVYAKNYSAAGLLAGVALIAHWFAKDVIPAGVAKHCKKAAPLASQDATRKAYFAGLTAGLFIRSPLCADKALAHIGSLVSRIAAGVASRLHRA